MWAVVPLKSPDEAKSRLTTVLNAVQRRELFFALAERVIRALHATPGIDVVAVVTASTEVATFARSLQAEVIRHAADFGTASAFASAVLHLQPMRLERLLMIAGDLPLVSSATLQPLVALADAQPGVVIVPDRHGLGTNALLCTPPGVIAPCFGSNSFQHHLRAAETAGVPARVLQLEALALDLDVAADLEYLRVNGGTSGLQLLQTLWQTETPTAFTREAAGVTR
jgi:2-phospho-L-lactate/phosphoenolpyruvate guanylyltransferase